MSDDNSMNVSAPDLVKTDTAIAPPIFPKMNEEIKFGNNTTSTQSIPLGRQETVQAKVSTGFDEDSNETAQG